MIKRAKGIVFAGALGVWALAGCLSTRALSGAAFEPDPNVDRAVLRAAVEARVGEPLLGPARVERVYRWRPAPSRTLLVWVTCRGQGDTRGCTVAVGEQGDAGLRVLANEPVGWSVPQLAATADPALLVISGSDGRGTWTQSMRFDGAEGGTITFARRVYQDGY